MHVSKYMLTRKLLKRTGIAIIKMTKSSKLKNGYNSDVSVKIPPASNSPTVCKDTLLMAVSTAA